MKKVIVNADDFGHSKIFNEVIIGLAKNELISSTSAMVTRIDDSQSDQISELIEVAQAHNIDIGLHFEFENEDFKPEIKAQYDKFIDIFKFNPDHIDLHKSTYLQQSYPLITEFCVANNIPCRNHEIGSKNVLTTTNKSIDGTHMSLSELKELLANLKDNESYELVFHPGKYDPDSKSSLNEARAEDTDKITEINSFFEENNIKLARRKDLV